MVGVLEYWDARRREKLANKYGDQYMAPQVTSLLEPDGPGIPGQGAAGIQTQPGGLMSPAATAQYGVNMAALGHGQGRTGSDVLTQGMAQQGFMDRLKYTTEMEQEMMQDYGGYKDLSQRNTNAEPLYKDYTASVMPYREAFQGYNETMDNVQRANGVAGMSGIDAVGAMIAWSKMKKPKEALQKDDVENIKDAASYFGIADMVWKKAAGGQGVIPQRVLLEIINSMSNMRESRYKEYQDERTFHRGRFENAQLNPDVQMRQQMNVRPGYRQQAAPVLDEPELGGLIQPKGKLTKVQ